MTKRNIISFIVGLIVSSIISGVYYYILFLQTFDLFGIQYIIDPEGEDEKRFYATLLLFGFTIVIFIVLLLIKKKYSAIGSGIPLLLGLWILFKIGPIYFNKSNYYEQFNKEKWVSTSCKPIKMVRQLITSEELIGLSPNQIKNKLGEGNLSESGDFIIYMTDVYDCQFKLSISKNKIEKATILVFD